MIIFLLSPSLPLLFIIILLFQLAFRLHTQGVLGPDGHRQGELSVVRIGMVGGRRDKDGDSAGGFSCTFVWILDFARHSSVTCLQISF